MKIALSTLGKFHSFDLAREMHNRGVLTAIFSGYPWFKLKHERLPRESVKTFPFLHAPYMRFAPSFTPARLMWEWQDKEWFDRYVSSRLGSCDVFCGLSGSGLRSGRVAQSRGAKYVCDRGSSHIRVQDRILREEYKQKGMAFSGIDPRVIEREEAEYQLADVITVPSTFAFDSFVDSGVPRKKLRLAPYGVDLSAFYPCAPRSDSSFHILFVGGISIRKGVSYLLEAFEKLDCKRKRLTLVGSVSPEMTEMVAGLGRDSRINVTGHVPQHKLKEFMSRSHVMVLPSVEDGLGLVQAQSMACGCPVIASQNTGAYDLFTDGTEGFIVPIRDSGAIADRLQRLADDREVRIKMSDAALQRVKTLGGWERYGETMFKIFSEVVAS
ncbi:MAG TPA: glycosyltransferase [Candidatus Acidoferrum sp.]